VTDRYILRDTRAGVMTITLNRPDVLNSCNRAMVGELCDAFAKAASRDEVRAVLLTGAGRAFCAGQDLAEAMPPEPEPSPEIADLVEGYNALIRAMRELEKPVVGAVNGVAAGAGANIALACDIVVAAETAAFIQASRRSGSSPTTAAPSSCRASWGWRGPRASRCSRTGCRRRRPWRGDDPPGGAGGGAARHRARARRAARDAAHARAGADQAGAQRVVRERPLAQLDLERDLQREAGRTADYVEGVRAFQAKRPPVSWGAEGAAPSRGGEPRGVPPGSFEGAARDGRARRDHPNS
jgi:2-(1,2-epoxy-1,2-dihydrophenyl)acetyl-CoA isomerase